MKLGVCYYPEHWPQERWPIDARMMREAGISLVRIGEFAWGMMEPTENRYSWDWLDQAIETLANQALQVILCTPTATPPAWLCRAYPDILPVDEQGHRRQFGSRRHYCSNNPTYRAYTQKIVSAMGQRYGEQPAIVGWQIDNELGCHNTARCYCPECALKFRLWLKEKYGTLSILNQTWGAVFWSQAYQKWEDIDPPNLTVTEANPSHLLDYYRFCSDSVIEYQQIQLEILKKYCPEKSITTNLMGNFYDIDYPTLARNLDFVTWDSYPTGYREMQPTTEYVPDETRSELAYDAGDPYITGFYHDLMRGLKQAPFWVMEQQCGHINWSEYNTHVRPGVVRLWTWHALAAGAEAVVYFRWRACRYAQEQHHSGLLKHDARPDTGYQDLLSMIEESSLMKTISAQPHTAKVALLFDYADLWALDLQPHNKDFDYLRGHFTFYRALTESGVAVDVVPIQADLNGYRLVIAPSAFLGSQSASQKLEAYSAAGGALVLGVRSGFKTPTNLVTEEPLPGVFGDLTGVTVDHWHSLPPAVGYTIDSEISGLEGQAMVWAEALSPRQEHEGFQVLARYTSGPFNNSAALTHTKFGEGGAYYLGWYPSLAQAKAITQYLLDIHGVPNRPVPSGMIMIARGEYILLLNFTDKIQSITIQGANHSINPRDVKVLKG
jgi:beta-galactosidase